MFLGTPTDNDKFAPLLFTYYSMKNHFTILFLLGFFLSYAQNRPDPKKVLVTGKIIEKDTKLPLEYATVTLKSTIRKDFLTGGITNEKGDFSIEVPVGTYDIKAEFISFKSIDIKGKSIKEDTNLGTLFLAPDLQQLNEVEVVAERSTVEIKLDKKVYNVGADMIVKGGTISDVLDNVPSVAVDADGSVTLRGNENVRILIDGKPSGLAGININDALKSLPADSVEKVEVITNPSARYDAEGGAGIINIVLKKGKNTGLNGSVLLTAGIPDNQTVSTNLSYKTKKFNVFTTQGYGFRNSPGNFINDTKYLNPDNTVKNYIYEKRRVNRRSNGYNGNLGIELYLTENTSWTHVINYRENTGLSPDNVDYYDYDANKILTSIRNRLNNQDFNGEDFSYATNFVKKFKKDGHKLTFDASVSKNYNNTQSVITEKSLTSSATPIITERTKNNQNQNRHFVQTDYVLPFGKNNQLEVGYRADYSELITDYKVDSLNNGVYIPNLNFTNKLEYKEKINAVYSQLGTKINKVSLLGGLRVEHSNIDINQITTQDFNKKQYVNFFPSAFITYEFSETSNFSVNYSRRITRPRDRFINPFSEYSSNINFFQGNPDLDPAISNVYDIGYLKRWNKLTFNTSAYYNNTNNSFQVVRRESGMNVTTVVDGKDIVDSEGNVTVVGGTDFTTPVVLTTPVNIGFTDKIGFEFTLNYTPFKWWRLNGNYNFFRNETHGSFSYINSQTGQSVTQRFDNVAFSWFTRINSRISFPKGIDFQLNGTYNAPMKNAQGNIRAVLSGNLAISKDLLKEKATITLNVQDIFNSRKRLQDTYLSGVMDSYREMQFRERQITLSFTYRFNKKKNEKERTPTNNNGGGGDEY